jgi:hypothetical protein
LEETLEEVIMGADYIYTYIDIGESLDYFVQDTNAVINDASDEVLARLMHMIYDEEDYDNARIILFNLIEAFHEVVVNARDIALLQVKDSIVVFTGGYSWGDDPTDSFDIVMSVKDIAIEMRNSNG